MTRGSVPWLDSTKDAYHAISAMPPRFQSISTKSLGISLSERSLGMMLDQKTFGFLFSFEIDPYQEIISEGVMSSL